MRWWWCIMYTFFYLMHESPFLFVRQQEKLSVKSLWLFLWGVCPTQKSGGLQGWPRKPVRTEEPVIRVCLYSNAYKYKYSISIFSYILTFKYMSSLSPLTKLWSRMFDLTDVPHSLIAMFLSSQNIFLFYSILLARRTANYLTLCGRAHKEFWTTIQVAMSRLLLTGVGDYSFFNFTPYCFYAWFVTQWSFMWKHFF